MTFPSLTCAKCGGVMPHHNAWCEDMRSPTIVHFEPPTSAPCPVCEAAHALTLSGNQSDAEGLIKAAFVAERMAKESAEAERDRLSAENARLRAVRDAAQSYMDSDSELLAALEAHASDEDDCERRTVARDDLFAALRAAGGG